MNALETVKHYQSYFASGFIQGAPTECWLWKGDRGSSGDAKLRIVPPMLAKNFAWILAHEAIPERHRIVQTCGDLMCVNPGHLRAVFGQIKPAWNACLTHDVADRIRDEFSAHVVAVNAWEERYGTDRRTAGDKPKDGTINALARRYGVSYGTVHAVVSNTAWVREGSTWVSPLTGKRGR